MGDSSIEINGRKYDARTGRLVSGTSASPAQTRPSSNRSMDIAARPAPIKQVHKTLERSKTLMRHAVKKPAAAAPKPTTHNTFSHKSKFSDDTISPARSVSALAGFHKHTDPQREARAKVIKKSALVSKFQDFGAPTKSHHFDQPVPSRIAPLPVQPAPKHAEPRTVHATTPAPAQLHKSESVLARGLKNAQSHTESAPKVAKVRRKHSKLVRIGASAFAVILLIAFFTYQNIPMIAMRYAAARSGVSAQLPGYQPSGFSLNSHIQYNPGQIKISFHSTSDDRNFTITQRTSNWDSAALENNYVASTSDQVQRYEDKGRTIFLYGDSNATWVNGGIWYDINGNSQLNSDQLVRIASSM